MQTFYLSYKLLQTMFMAVVFLSLIFSLLLLFLLYELRPYMWKCYRNWNSFLFFFLFLLLNHLAYSFHQINNGEKYYKLLPVPIVILWCIVGIIDFLLVRESIHLKKKMKEKVSQNSIKEALNLLPVGICYFTLNGTIKLCNSQMYRLFRTLAHKDLQKLSELREALHSNIQNEVIRLTDKKEIYLFPDGRAWNYQESEVKDKEGNVYIEAVFSDVTKQYHEKINLTRQTEKLKEISRELRYLSDNVLILTREKEVLAAKTKLHDQMGAGLTAIRQSLAQENADYSNAVRLLRQAVNAIWNDNQYPLEEGEFERFLQDARTIGVKVRCTGSLPKEEEYAHIYILAMRECLTNGVCHAGATELFITMQEDKDCYHICITNNGEVPEKEVVPKGGLYNLSRHIFDYSGEMHIQSMPYFALTITFQKKELDHEEGIDCRGSEDAS